MFNSSVSLWDHEDEVIGEVTLHIWANWLGVCFEEKSALG